FDSRIFLLVLLFFFFFSSRRRHTRFSRDWSSDVCSSDLQMFPPRSPLGISCQTKIPILSQCLYQRAGSTLMCLRIILNPISFVFSTSNFNASSDGAVCRPSGHQPWSNGP